MKFIDMTDTEILKLFLMDCITTDFICDELAPSEWCENHCGHGQDRPYIECVRKYYSELAKPLEEGK